jgi:hypothetical protein
MEVDFSAVGGGPSASHLANVMRRQGVHDVPAKKAETEWFLPRTLEARRVWAMQLLRDRPDARDIMFTDEQGFNAEKLMPR